MTSTTKIVEIHNHIRATFEKLAQDPTINDVCGGPQFVGPIMGAAWLKIMCQAFPADDVASWLRLQADALERREGLNGHELH